jgi:hypothetical protein
VAHAYNTSYSGVRDQEDCSSKPAQRNRLQDPTLKKNITKRDGGMIQAVGSEFKPQYCKIKNPHFLLVFINIELCVVM